MKKGTILIMVLGLLIFLLLVIGFVAYNLLYVPGNYAMKVENVATSGTNIVYIYENGKVLFNNDGVNTLKKSMSKEDVQELLGQVDEYEIPTRVYVVTTKDGKADKETCVTNPLIDSIGEKIGVKNIFTEGTNK